jgi:hypothetical protein
MCLFYQSLMIDGYRALVLCAGEGGNRSGRRENCSTATSSTTNSIWTTLASNMDIRCEKPATNHLSYDTDFLATYYAKWIVYGSFRRIYCGPIPHPKCPTKYVRGVLFLNHFGFGKVRGPNPRNVKKISDIFRFNVTARPSLSSLRLRTWEILSLRQVC